MFRRDVSGDWFAYGTIAKEKRWPVALCFLALAAFKLALVSDHEIVASYSPHDSYWHIRSASVWMWGQPYNEWTLMHLPVYALFIAVTGVIGLPLRMSIEICYLAGAATASFSLRRLGLSTPLQVLTFALIAFHPYSYQALDFAMAEMLYVCQMLFFVGFFIGALLPESRSDLRWNTGLFAITAAFMWYCRTESILIGGLFALIVLTIAGAFLLKFAEKAAAIRFGLNLVIAPAAAVATVGMLISTTNGLRYGLWQSNEMTAPNFVRLYQSLEAIRPDRPIRFVPVTRAVRFEAYAVSPVFREMQPFLDGADENWGAGATRRAMGLGGGEIAAGWFYWTLVGAAAASGHFETAQGAEAYFGRAADEITAALKDGRLPSRTVILPFIDPSYALWLPHLPASMMTLASYLNPSKPLKLPERAQSVAPHVAALFDRVANRRTYGTKGESYVARGWTLGVTSQPTLIQIVTVHGDQVPSEFESVPRPDMDLTAPPGQRALGFRVEWWAAGRTPDQFRLKVSFADGTSALSEPISTLPIGAVTRLSAASGDLVIPFAIDQLQKPRFIRIIDFLNQRYFVVLLLFGIAAGIRLIVVLLERNFRVGMQDLVLLFVFAIIISRLLFFAILDASAWSAEQTRYLFPMAVLLVLVPAIVFTVGRQLATKTKPAAPGAMRLAKRANAIDCSVRDSR